ncbi:hypothetical protein [Streptomyces sp. NPDC001980]|uniref:hypothetical protein n=1 Tax=Streptomyces sp. NPDC001980 TaxID=3157126 RepID=UPI003318AE8D
MNPSLGVRALIIFSCASFSTNVGMAAAWLNHMPGTPAGQAVLYGGGSFGGCMLLCLAVLKALKVL